MLSLVALEVVAIWKAGCYDQVHGAMQLAVVRVFG